jgi:tetratricopeptide (TPR) repeat protein
MNSTKVARTRRSLPTYGLGAPEKNPLFFEKRVYQGSCGKVYPVPFIDKVFDTPEPVAYDLVDLENDYVRLTLMPEIGGRIFLGQDKTNQDYDFFYRQDVIKPALVGLAGPWISGGVEFNWPQHHRPGTYLPTDVAIETARDGSTTVWMSEHDPLNRLKGMHGICLHNGSALIELKARLYNRTPLTQTFLWWANVAARVHDRYQSFFPPDVHYVADHAVRAMSSFPAAENDYYGVDYASRSGANDLSFYKNIPVPTSYMVCQTKYDFFGGYDYEAKGGFIHVANRHLSPGKKQWTWGNHEFGWAWDRELTDEGGPYVELMAGVHTDNQPDFSYIAPYETKTFSQYWWPYQKLGPVQEANILAALRCVADGGGRLDLGLAVVRPMEGVRIVVQQSDKVLWEETVTVSPDRPWQNQSLRFSGDDARALCVRVFNAAGEAVIGYRPVDRSALTRDRDVATEPPLPDAIDSNEELYLTGEHLEQYRHPTRYPELYWQEALERDPNDVRCNIALGRQKLGRGCFSDAARHFETAVARLTFRHPNPETGEAHYYLGLARRFLGDDEAAYALFYKATWNYAWRAAACYELACLDLRNGDAARARQHLDASLETNATNNKAHVLKAICLRRLGQPEEAAIVLAALLATDPLDHWALAEQAGGADGAPHLAAVSRNDAQTALDIAFDYADAGCFAEALSVLEHHAAAGVTDVAVPNPLQHSQMTVYAEAWLQARSGHADAAAVRLAAARSLSPDYCFPSRLHEMVVLEWAVEQPGADAIAAYGLGNFYFDKKRHEDAIAAWEQSREANPGIAVVHRNLGIAYWNVRREGAAARAAYERALTLHPGDSRLVAEFDQLCAKLGDPPAARLAFLEAHQALVAERDDATVELAALYNETGHPEKALEIFRSRRFHPWEGGEGKVLRQYTAARLLLGRKALEQGDARTALEHFHLALDTPDHLGEKYHLLQSKADVLYWQGRAHLALGREDEATAAFTAAANESGDFQSMAFTAFSELTIFKALALRELGCEAKAQTVLTAMATYAEREMDIPARIDYFATSLPNLLVFEEDLDASKRARMQHLLALAGNPALAFHRPAPLAKTLRARGQSM